MDSDVCCVGKVTFKSCKRGEKNNTVICNNSCHIRRLLGARHSLSFIANPHKRILFFSNEETEALRSFTEGYGRFTNKVQSQGLNHGLG